MKLYLEIPDIFFVIFWQNDEMTPSFYFSSLLFYYDKYKYMLWLAETTNGTELLWFLGIFLI